MYLQESDELLAKYGPDTRMLSLIRQSALLASDSQTLLQRVS